MGVDLYQLGVSGLMASQQQLTTTGHNIANVNTAGYNRQRAEQVTTPAIWVGGNWYGSGVKVDDVTRLFDRYAYRESLLAKSRLSYADTLSTKLSGLDSTLSRGGKVVTDSLQEFYKALNAVADKPGDIGLRQILLDKSDVLSSEMQTLTSTLSSQRELISSEISQVMTRVGEIADEIAALNQKLIANQGVTGGQNDLLDQRDRLLTELSEYVSVSSYEHQSGAISVFIGQGQTLVTEVTALDTQTVPGDPDPLMTEVVLTNRGALVQLDESSLGGKLGALFAYRDDYLKQSLAELDLVAMGIAETINGQQARGLDLNGLAGANLFADINGTSSQQARMLARSGNSGTLVGEIRIDAVGDLTGSDYRVDYNGTDYILTNLTSGAATTLGAPGAGPFATADGFTFVEASGAPSAGDSWIVRPTRNGVANFNVELQQASGIAAATPVAVVASSNNVSSGRVEIAQVNDPVAARALTNMRLEVLEDPPGTFTYTLYDSSNAVMGTGAYTPPEQTIDVPPLPAPAAFSLKISGQPSGQAPFAPERFDIRDAFGVGNGDNALKLAATQSQKILKDGQFAFNEAITANANLIGAQASSAEASYQSAGVMNEQAVARIASASGVNLDEEAANLLRYQQAYQASARIVSVAQTLFDTILQSVR